MRAGESIEQILIHFWQKVTLLLGKDVLRISLILYLTDLPIFSVKIQPYAGDPKSSNSLIF